MRHSPSAHAARRVVIVSLAAASVALSAATDPVGFEFLTVHADGPTLLGERVFPSIVASGVVDAASGAEMTDDQVDFGSFLDGNSRYVIELGPPLLPKVVEVVSFSGNTLTLAESGSAPTGAVYQLRPMRRLSELFNPVDVPDLNVAEDFDPETGDLFLLPDGAGGYREYFYSTQAGFDNFFNAETGGEEDPFLRPTDALWILRRGESYDTAYLGEVKTGDTAVPLVNRFSPISSINPVATLEETGLDTSLQQGTAETADIVWSQDTVTGALLRYYYSDGTGPGLTSGWRLADPPPGGENTDQGDVFVSAGLVVRRHGPLPHFVTISPAAPAP